VRNLDIPVNARWSRLFEEIEFDVLALPRIIAHVRDHQQVAVTAGYTGDVFPVAVLGSVQLERTQVSSRPVNEEHVALFVVVNVKYAVASGLHSGCLVDTAVLQLSGRHERRRLPRGRLQG
jgi:hypothetical protein